MVSKKLLVFIPFVFLYMVWMDKGVAVVDPCSATPGYEYAEGLAALVSFPFAAGALLHGCLRGCAVPKSAKRLAVGLLPTVLLGISCFSVTCFLYRIEAALRNTKVWSLIYDVDCHHDAEPKMIFWFSAISIVFYLFLLLCFAALRACIGHKGKLT